MVGEGSADAASGLLAAYGPGSRLAGYLLEEQVGAGGMAVVFRAVDERLGRRVALKILAPALASDQAFQQRFSRESRAAAAVDDPHILPVYEAGEAGGILFIAMRLVPGKDVRTLLHQEGPLPPERAAAIISQVASALDAAHAAGLVHRDVKPANMLIDVRPGRADHVYLSDFGISKGVMSSVSLTATNQFLGTPEYAAPEQIEGQVVDGRADQYAMACSAFELLAGQTPFRRDQGMAVLWAQLHAPPPPLGALRPELPDAADAVLAQALAKAPEDRFSSCQGFAEALTTALGSAPSRSGAGPAAPLQPPMLPQETQDTRPRPGNQTAGQAQETTSPQGADQAARELPRDDAETPGESGEEIVGVPVRRAIRRRPAVIASGALIAIIGVLTVLVLTLMTRLPTTHVRWVYSIRGLGARTAVANGTVYVGTAGQVYALDAATGRLRWAHAIQGGSGMAVAGGVVYGSEAGKVYALDAATGHLRWAHAPALTVSTPAVAGGTVYVYNLGVDALDAVTGRLRWTFHTGNFSFSSPVVAGGTVYVGSDDDKVYALDAVTGHLRWTFNTNASVESTPAVAGGTVYVGSDDDQVYALDAATGRLRWASATGGAVTSSPAVAEGTVYVGSWDHSVYALDAATGRLRWSYVTGDKIESSPAVVRGTVYVGSDDDQVYALDAATGRLRWAYTTGDKVASTPVVADGTVYVGSYDHKVYALSVRP